MAIVVAQLCRLPSVGAVHWLCRIDFTIIIDRCHRQRRGRLATARTCLHRSHCRREQVGLGRGCLRRAPSVVHSYRHHRLLKSSAVVAAVLASHSTPISAQPVSASVIRTASRPLTTVLNRRPRFCLHRG